MSRLGLALGVTLGALVVTAAPPLLAARALARLHPPPAPAVARVGHAVGVEHVALGHEDDVVTKVDSPEAAATTSEARATPPATTARRVPAPPPMGPAAATTELLRARVDRQLETLPICRRGEGPEGRGVATVVLAADGAAKVVLASPFQGTPRGACVARRLAGAAAPHEGGDVTIRVAFEL